MSHWKKYIQMTHQKMSGQSNKMINHDQEDRTLQSRNAFLVLLCDNVAIAVPLQMSDSSAVLVIAAAVLSDSTSATLACHFSPELCYVACEKLAGITMGRCDGVLAVKTTVVQAFSDSEERWKGRCRKHVFFEL